MAMSDRLKNSIYFHYSPTYKQAIGIEQVTDKYFDKDYSYLRYTHLLNRKNTKHSQRNLYLQLGISSEELDHNFYEIHGDWETRRWFTGFSIKKTERAAKDSTSQYIQLGVAPYLGDYGDLHTWLMLKTKKDSLSGNNWSTAPVLKFFKGNALIEVSYDREDEWSTHFMYRF